MGDGGGCGGAGAGQGRTIGKREEERVGAKVFDARDGGVDGFEGWVGLGWVDAMHVQLTRSLASIHSVALAS